MSADPHSGIDKFFAVFLRYDFVNFQFAAFVPGQFFREQGNLSTVGLAFRIKRRMGHFGEISVDNQVLRKTSACTYGNKCAQQAFFHLSFPYFVYG